MANSIALAKNYTALLDEVYKNASLTSVLDSDATTARQGANVNEILVPKLDMDGLGDYDRNSGYTKGDVKLTYETVKFNYDRGRKFEVDYLDNEESAGIAFGRLAGEFIRTKVVPEGDAFTFATLAGITGISKAEGATYTTGNQVLEALVSAQTKMDEDEVPAEDRHLFITPTLLRMAQNVEKTVNTGILDTFASITSVPQTRFYTAIELLDGKTDGEVAGGYKKAVDGADINFMIVHKPAVLKYNKHTASNIITPEANQDSDGYIQKYRKYGLVDAYENKVAGIYLSHKAGA